MDQELQHIQQANEVTRAWRASGQLADATAYAAASGMQTSEPPSCKYDVTSEIRLH